jgi:hypothetical protein
VTLVERLRESSWLAAVDDLESLSDLLADAAVEIERLLGRIATLELAAGVRVRDLYRNDL